MATSPPDASNKLYTPSLLALSVELSEYPLDPGAPLQGSARSRTCGSEVLLSAHPDEAGGMRQIGMQVTACAVGQASAAIFADHAPGLSREEIAGVLDRLEQWLEGDVPSDFLPRLERLEAARAFPARHGALLLPWRAAIDALA